MAYVETRGPAECENCAALRDRIRSLEARLAQIHLESGDGQGNAKWPDSCGLPIGSPCLRPAGHKGRCR